MNCCCNNDEPVGGVPSTSPTAISNPSAMPGRLLNVLRWALPVTVLALVPKCPACVAAYVLLLTGVGLSFPVAAAIRWALIAVSFATLGFLLLSPARRVTGYLRRRAVHAR